MVEPTWDTMAVAEGLELTVGPAVEHPVLGADPGVVGLVFRLVPITLNLIDERILGSSGAILGLDALLLQVAVQLLRVPATVWGDGVAVPVALDQLLEVLAVSRCGVGDAVVREPALKLSLVPSIVGCARDACQIVSSGLTRVKWIDIPALPQLLPAALATRAKERRALTILIVNVKRRNLRQIR